MRICMIVDDYPPKAGGGGIFVQELSKRLSSHNAITVLTPAYSLPEGTTDEGNVSIVRMGKGRIPFFLKASWFLLNSGKFDIYHAHSSSSGFLAKFASLFRGGKPVLHVHGFRGKELIGPIKYFGQIFLARLGHGRIISVDPISNGKLEAIGIPKDKISTISCGVDTEKFSPIPKRAPHPKTIFLFVGRLAKVKDLPTLLKASKIAQEKKMPMELWIVGEGEQENELKAFARDGGLQNVRFLGSVPHGSLPAIYQKSDFFVLPSLSEGNPLVLLEAMACGLPIIVSDAPSLPPIAEKSRSGFIFRRGDAEGLAGLLEKCSNLGRATVDALRNNSRKFSEENYSWEKVSGEVMKIYSRVLHGE